MSLVLEPIRLRALARGGRRRRGGASAAFPRAKYQTSWVTASDISSSDFSAFPLSWFACNCASAGSVANVFIVLAGGWPVTVSMLSQAS
jgi:hypothetical protein